MPRVYLHLEWRKKKKSSRYSSQHSSQDSWLLTALLTTQKVTPQKNAGSLLTLRMAKKKKVCSNCSGSQVRALSSEQLWNCERCKKPWNAHPVKKNPDAVSNLREHWGRASVAHWREPSTEVRSAPSTSQTRPSSPHNKKLSLDAQLLAVTARLRNIVTGSFPNSTA